MLQNSKTCPHCGQSIPYQTKYCSNCGAKFVVPTPDILLNNAPQTTQLSVEEAKKQKDEADHFQVG